MDAYAEPFKHRIIDIFCVAAHYSQRYENAEVFLNTQCKDTATHERVLYLKHHPEDQLIAKFVTTCMEPSPQTSVSISWKNMLYLWKVFIDDERIPNVFFVNALKARLTKHLPHYSESADAFLQLTSKHLPRVLKLTRSPAQAVGKWRPLFVGRGQGVPTCVSRHSPQHTRATNKAEQPVDELGARTVTE
jgi:hypothetical protein